MFSSNRLSRHEQALAGWREAEHLVAERWIMFLESEAEGRRWAFASYVAALDAEEHAAANLAAVAGARDAGSVGYALRAA
jgi:hypothetical protein